MIKMSSLARQNLIVLPAQVFQLEVSRHGKLNFQNVDAVVLAVCVYTEPRCRLGKYRYEIVCASMRQTKGS